MKLFEHFRKRVDSYSQTLIILVFFYICICVCSKLWEMCEETERTTIQLHLGQQDMLPYEHQLVPFCERGDTRASAEKYFLFVRSHCRNFFECFRMFSNVFAFLSFISPGR